MGSSQPSADLPWRSIGSIALVMVLGVSLLWGVIRQMDTTGVPTDNGTPAVAPTDVPTEPTEASGTPPGTPDEPASEWATGSLPWMLQHAPDRLSDNTLPLNDIASYADLASWTNATGRARPGSLDDPGVEAWDASLSPLAIPSSLRERGLDPAWRQSYGYSLLDVDQVLVVGQAPDYVTVMRGRFDPKTLQDAWVASGYQAVEVEGVTIWTLAPNDAIDLSAPESRPAMATMNNIVLLPDGTLMAATRTSRLQAALRMAKGNADPLATNGAIAPLLNPSLHLDRLVSAVIAKGTVLQGTAETMPLAASTPTSGTAVIQPVGTPGVATTMPEITTAVFGIPLPAGDPGGTPVAMDAGGYPLVILLVCDDLPSARTARTVVSDRLANDRSPVTHKPISDRLTLDQVTVFESTDRPVLALDLGLARAVDDWLAILASRDLSFAAWLP